MRSSCYSSQRDSDRKIFTSRNSPETVRNVRVFLVKALEMEARERPGHRESGDRPSQGSSMLSQVKNLHDEAFLYIDQGLTCDEQGQKDQAVTLYFKGISCIDSAVDVSQDLSPTEQRSVREMLTKMTNAKAQTKMQIDHILSSDEQTVRALEDPPPSYEVATSPTQSMEMVYPDSLLSDAVDSQNGIVEHTNASKLFSIQEGVQIFFISPEGNVSAPSYPSDLAVMALEKEAQSDSAVHLPPAFLRVGNWTYPLVPGASPVLRADWGAYIFPDVSSQTPGASVGVIVPDFLPVEERQYLEEIFANLTEFRHQDERTKGAMVAEVPELPMEGDFEMPSVEEQEEEERPQPRPAVPDDRTSAKISKGIVTGAEWLAWGLQKGAEKTGQLLQIGSEKLREKIQPDAKQAKIDPRYHTGVKYAKTAAGVACSVSSYIVEAVGKGTVALGNTLAPHVRKHSEKILPDSVKGKDAGGRSKLDDIVEVAAGGLKGFGTVYVGLEGAALALEKSITNETVHVVNHKYGQDAGKLTENTLYAVGGAGMTAYNMSNLGVKAIAKRTVKDAAKCAVEQHHRERNLAENSNGVVDKTLPPDDEDHTPPKRPPPPRKDP